MSDFVLPDSIAAQLKGFGLPVHLVDDSGQKLGYFVPAVDSAKYVMDGPEPTESELREAERSGEWFTTQEVLDHLESLK